MSKHPYTIPWSRPIVAQATILTVILALAITTLGITGYLLFHLGILKDMYHAEWREECRACTRPRWFTGGRSAWAQVAQVRYYTISRQWEPTAIASAAFTATTVAYIVSYLVLARRKDSNRTTRADITILLLLAVWGFACAGSYTSIRWWFGYASYTTTMYGEYESWRGTGPQYSTLSSERTCSDLGRACGPARHAQALIWPTAALPLLLAAGEAAYVLRVHGRRGLRHGLPFLSSLGEEQRANPATYEAHGVPRYRSGQLDLEADSLAPVPYPEGAGARAEQSDPPPMYTESAPSNRSPTESSTSTPSGWAAHKAAIVAPRPDEKGVKNS